MKKYIIELEKNVWIAPIFGDPGRTTVIECADIFHSKKKAEIALKQARVFRPFFDAKIVETINK